ncbi:MAG: SDR family NAD(P)-dependent oxidoreductase [Dehalococcoidia bacterium]
MAVSLEGKVALVTGAAVGIGNAYARALLDAGARVAVCDIRSNELSRLEGEVLARGQRLLAFTGDVASPGDVRRVVDGVLAEYGGVDILVNNAGYSPMSNVLEPLEKGLLDWDRVVGTNLKGTYLFGRALIPQFIAHGSGDIINVITDHAWNCGSPYPVSHADAPDCRWGGGDPRPTGAGSSLEIYDSSKWACLGLTLSWAKALRPHGVRVNALCMGATDTPLIREYFNFDPAPEYVRTWMRPEAVAAVLVELLQEGPAGRHGDFVGLWAGHPVVLPQSHPDFLATH